MRGFRHCIREKKTIKNDMLNMTNCLVHKNLFVFKFYSSPADLRKKIHQREMKNTLLRSLVFLSSSRLEPVGVPKLFDVVNHTSLDPELDGFIPDEVGSGLSNFNWNNDVGNLQ
jgi:hypothetical protein